jgi:hypothetical protein
MKLKTFMWISLLGLGITVALCPECFMTFKGLIASWKTILLCLLYTYILGYGCTFIISKIEGRYSWLEQPKKKFFLHFFTLTIFSFIVSALLFYVFAILMFEGEKWVTFSEVMNQAKLPAFISVSIATFFTGADFLGNWKLEAVRAERLEKEKIATQYESLRNQVNPHFLFNSLNALSELVYENQALAVKYIHQLSKVYRYVLDSRNTEAATLRDELDFVESFVFLQKIRFGENLDVSIEVKKSDSEFILPLSLQILIENAIKHNVVSEEDPLRISIYKNDQYIVVNNELRKKESMDEGTGIGLENIRMRYKYLTDQPVTIEESEKEFVVKIPILEQTP